MPSARRQAGISANPRAVAGVAGGMLLAVTVLLGLLLELDDGAPTLADQRTAAWATALREGSAWVEPVSRALNWVGGGVVAVLVVPALILGALALARRWRDALLTVVAMVVSLAAVQLMKSAFGRVRPEEMLVTSDAGSFPSGHTSNAATLAVLAVVLLGGGRRRRWVALVGAGYVAAMAVSRLALSVHWLTDVVGGAAAGTGAVLLVVALMPPTRPAETDDDDAAGGRAGVTRPAAEMPQPLEVEHESRALQGPALSGRRDEDRVGEEPG